MEDGIFIFQDNLIVNVAVLDPTGQWQPPEGHWAMPIPEGCSAWIGWRYIDEQWVPPPQQTIDIELGTEEI